MIALRRKLKASQKYSQVTLLLGYVSLGQRPDPHVVIRPGGNVEEFCGDLLLAFPQHPHQVRGRGRGAAAGIRFQRMRMGLC